MWARNVGPKCGSEMRARHAGPTSGHEMWARNVGPKCGPKMWARNVGPKCGPEMWPRNVSPKCGPEMWARMGQWTPFWPNLCAKRPILGSKNAFFSKKIFAPNHFLSLPRWCGTLKNPKLALYTPQWTPNDLYWLPRWSGTLKTPKTGLLHPPPIWAAPAATHPARSLRFWGPKSRFSQLCIFVQNDISGVLTSLSIGF